MTKTFTELYPPKDEGPAYSTSFPKRIVRILYDTIRGFIEDDCYNKASALTFYSLLSIVPVLAVLFGIAKGFGFEHALESEIHQRFSEQKEIMQKLIQFSYSMLQNVKGGLIAGIGIGALLWTVLGLLGSIENTLNSIWKVPVGRSYSRKISDYLATMIISPIFLVASSSITVYLTTHISENVHSNVLFETIGPYLLFIVKLFPFFLSWILFTYIYYCMPNTKVFFRSALIAGIIAGTAFQLWQWIYISFQIGVASYGAVYGSFAAIPLFLVWLQTSCLIFLAGAELAFEIENDLFIPYRRPTTLSSKAAALLITYRSIEAFANQKPPITDRSLAHELGISLSHLHTILEALESGGILSTVTYRGQTTGYQPALPVESITFARVCQAIDKRSDLVASIQISEALEKVQRYLVKADQEMADASSNKPVYPS